MENKLEKIDSVSADIRHFQNGPLFGTWLDKIDDKKMPTKYIAIDFREMNHDQLSKFFMATDREKFEMAYWAQRTHEKKSGKIGIILGVILTIFLTWILYKINSEGLSIFIVPMISISVIGIMYWCYIKFGWFFKQDKNDFIEKY